MKIHNLFYLRIESRKKHWLFCFLVFFFFNYQEWKFTTYFICALKLEKNTGFFVTPQSMCVQNTSFDLCCDLWPAEFFGQMVCYQGDLCIENYTAKGGDEIWYVRTYRHLAIYRKCVIFSQKVVLPCFILIDSQHIYHFYASCDSAVLLRFLWRRNKYGCNMIHDQCFVEPFYRDVQ